MHAVVAQYLIDHDERSGSQIEWHRPGVALVGGTTKSFIVFLITARVSRRKISRVSHSINLRAKRVPAWLYALRETSIISGWEDDRCRRPDGWTTAQYVVAICGIILRPARTNEIRPRDQDTSGYWVNIEKFLVRRIRSCPRMCRASYLKWPGPGVAEIGRSMDA